ncbi:MAG TPA: hypothetical protein VLJ58_08185 [Ramlibacter sp.]|nr:hypothetical protein [Ramlibacter sp.]
MRPEPIQVLQAASRTVARPAAAASRLLIAGATGALGNEVLRRLVGLQGAGSTQVLAREPLTEGLRGVRTLLVPPLPPSQWPAATADTAVVLFDPPRLYYDRERALWTPEPAQLPEVAGWLRASGVGTLAVVLPHAQGRLPEALKRGLASLDEHAVAQLGFDRLVIIRSAQRPQETAPAGPLHGLARWMLSITRLMVPSSEQPVRAAKVAQLLAAALRLAPPGIHVAGPELVWQAAQGDAAHVAQVAARWLQR